MLCRTLYASWVFPAVIFCMSKFENTKWNNKTLLSRFPFCLQLLMNYTPLGWCEQEYRRYKAHFEALPRAPCSLCLFALKVESHSYWPSVWNRCFSFWNRSCFTFSHQNSRLFHLRQQSEAICGWDRLTGYCKFLLFRLSLVWSFSVLFFELLKAIPL